MSMMTNMNRIKHRMNAIAKTVAQMTRSRIPANISFANRMRSSQLKPSEAHEQKSGQKTHEIDKTINSQPASSVQEQAAKLSMPIFKSLYSSNDEQASTIKEKMPQINPLPVIQKPEPIKPPDNLKIQKEDIDRLTEKYAKQYQLDPTLIRQLISVASNDDPATIGKQGQIGLMQVKPEIFSKFGIKNPFDPEQNIMAGTAHLSSILRSSNSLANSLAAYNTDPQTIERFKGVPPFAETKSFVNRVLSGLGTAE